jgi:hypothetical protein
MMNKTLYIIIVVFVAAIVGFSYFMYTKLYTPSAPTEPYVNPYSYSSGEPGGSVGAGTTPVKFTVAARGGARITVKNFLTNGETAADAVNPGYYYLAGSAGYCLASGKCIAGAKETDFAITYRGSDSLFVIELLKEPLGQSRQEAEKFLTDRLGISGQKMCSLVYIVEVSPYINGTYSGTNLGFSFCTGATELP